eukprot:3138737-Alexandrium_andersonii.AAC.1
MASASKCDAACRLPSGADPRHEDAARHGKEGREAAGPTAVARGGRSGGREWERGKTKARP